MNLFIRVIQPYMQTKEERKQQCREYSRRKIREQNYYIETQCRLCQNPVLVKKYAERYYIKKGGGTCKECLRKNSSKILKSLRASQTPQERSQHSSLARAKANCSIGVENQWKTLRSDPKKFEQICLAKSNRMKLVWENYPEETRNHIVSSLAASKDCGRSKLSEEFKQQLIAHNLYDGFTSEEVFHGFVPDEINHDLKIIIEVYGDVYHCNPRKYNNPDLFVTAIRRTVKEQWKRDEKKLASYYRNGYSVIIVWEYDIRKHLLEQIERVRTEIKRKQTYGIHASH